MQGIQCKMTILENIASSLQSINQSMDQLSYTSNSYSADDLWLSKAILQCYIRFIHGICMIHRFRWRIKRGNQPSPFLSECLHCIYIFILKEREEIFWTHILLNPFPTRHFSCVFGTFYQIILNNILQKITSMYNFDLYIKLKCKHFSLPWHGSWERSKVMFQPRKSTIFFAFWRLKVIFNPLVTTIGFADIMIEISTT